MFINADEADRRHDLRKQDWRPGDPLPLNQRYALARLLGSCESLVGSGKLDEITEIQLRMNIASVLSNFNMPANSQVSEDNCPGHVASANPKICARCGVHIESLRP